MDRLFVGCFPGGLVYADRAREEQGDYKHVAFLPYDTLQLSLKQDCPVELKSRIEEDAFYMKAQKGKLFPISGNLSVTLGTQLRSTS